jgi:hypothetical protein
MRFTTEDAMKTIRIAAALTTISLALLASRDARAQQNSAQASANASAAIVAAISISNTADLDFGQVVAGGSSGTVVMSTAGSRSATGGTTLGSSAGSGAASFTVSGDPNASYTITLPGSAVLSSDGDDMIINNFTSNPSGNGTIGGGGSQVLGVGATLQVGASQPAGSYSGSFNVTIAYN